MVKMIDIGIKLNNSAFLFVIIILLITTNQQNLYAGSAPISQAETELLKKSVFPLQDLYDNKIIIKLIGQKPVVLIGDSTHGTHEFYQQRINLSKRLIEEKNFKLILLEGGWPAIYAINQYIQSKSSLNARQVLNIHNPDAASLWNNHEMLRFIQWLKNYNEQLSDKEQKVTIHGMDIYSFRQSKKLLIDYLQALSPQAAQQAKRRYQCFSYFNNNLHTYGKAVSRNPSHSCQSAVVNQYQDFSQCRFPCPEQYPAINSEAFFYAKQNARVIKNTEQSMRIQYMTGNDTESWNQRDLHMLESLLASMEYVGQNKAIIWAHNSHIGDARATDMRQRSQLNLGQLLREHFQQDIYSIGMLTYSGTVMAADEWHTPTKIKVLLAAHPDSNEALLHGLNIAHFVLPLHQSEALFDLLNRPRLQRHVGVVYKPADEFNAHYSGTLLAEQFDAIIFKDKTHAITPLK